MAGGFTGAIDPGDFFGYSVANLGDLDQDGTIDIAVGAERDDDGGTDRGAVWILFMNPDGTVKAHQKISDTQGNFTAVLDNTDRLGSRVASLGDLNGDGNPDLAASATQDDDAGADAGCVYIMFLNNDGTVISHLKLTEGQNGFTGVVDPVDNMGSPHTIGDLDGDGVIDLAIGATHADDGGSNRGEVWINLMNSNGTIKSQSKISDLAGNFNGVLNDSSDFGSAVVDLGDINGDGMTDLAVGSDGDIDGGALGSFRGAVWILNINSIPVINPIILRDGDVTDNTTPTLHSNNLNIEAETDRPCTSGLTMQLSDDNFVSTIFIGCTPGQTTAPFTLDPGNGLKTVYTRLTNVYGTNATTTATINLDQTPADLTFNVATGRNTWGFLDWTASDNLSGVQSVYLNLGGAPGGSELFSGDVTNQSQLGLSGALFSNQFAEFSLLDNAGNASVVQQEVVFEPSTNTAPSWELLP